MRYIYRHGHFVAGGLSVSIPYPLPRYGRRSSERTCQYPWDGATTLLGHLTRQRGECWYSSTHEIAETIYVREIAQNEKLLDYLKNLLAHD